MREPRSVSYMHHETQVVLPEILRQAKIERPLLLGQSDGALFGRTPAEAFYVKCNEENNPPENRDAGMLTVEIGIAPVKPAEFVIFRISQFADGAGLEE